jgi:signal peptidase II
MPESAGPTPDETPPADALSAGTPAAETPAAKPPAAETAAAETPAAKPPAAETATETPAAGSKFSKYLPLIWVAGIIIAVDQTVKITILKTLTQGTSIPVLGDWLRLTYTENPGMAFGIEFGVPGLVTIFSIVATILIVVYLARVGIHYGPYRYSLALVLGGAFGNIIDRVLYGMLFYDEPLFLGRVVDYFHVNLWRGYVPESVPFVGGKYLALFPIWNFADMAIVTGVVGILVFQRAFHRRISEMEVDGELMGGGPSEVATS